MKRLQKRRGRRYKSEIDVRRVKRGIYVYGWGCNPGNINKQEDGPDKLFKWGGNENETNWVFDLILITQETGKINIIVEGLTKWD